MRQENLVEMFFTEKAQWPHAESRQLDKGLSSWQQVWKFKIKHNCERRLWGEQWNSQGERQACSRLPVFTGPEVLARWWQDIGMAELSSIQIRGIPLPVLQYAIKSVKKIILTKCLWHKNSTYKNCLGQAETLVKVYLKQSVFPNLAFLVYLTEL